jgi:hypothetical protein
MRPDEIIDQPIPLGLCHRPQLRGVLAIRPHEAECHLAGRVGWRRVWRQAQNRRKPVLLDQIGRHALVAIDPGFVVSIVAVNQQERVIPAGRALHQAVARRVRCDEWQVKPLFARSPACQGHVELHEWIVHPVKYIVDREWVAAAATRPIVLVAANWPLSFSCAWVAGP